MKDRKRTSPGASRQGATIDRDREPGLAEPGEEAKLPSRNPAPASPADEPNPNRKNQVDDEIDGVDEDDDATGEMDAAGQDVGLAIEERAANSIEDSATEDEEADWIDHDDDTDKGRGQFD
ncbi:MAG: hypothetical protein ABIP29_02560 [Candidatus Eisenbacteria bacterium]